MTAPTRLRAVGLATWTLLAALVPAALTTGCRPDPSSSYAVLPSWPAEHRAELEAYVKTSYAAWMTCTSRLKPIPPSAGQADSRRFTLERKLPEDGYADVVGTRIRLPLSGWLRSPERRLPITTHEMGHTWGIEDVDTGAEPAIMSKTTPSNTLTARDCAELCKLWWCGRS